MAFGLLIVGDEILSGKRSDKHFSKVIELLAARGLALSWMRCVGDEPSRITSDLKDAFASGDVVFSCGGIGATPDDHTRQCAADALGRPLVLHPRARELIVERMRDVAAEKGEPFVPERPDNLQRLQILGSQLLNAGFNTVGHFTQTHGSGEPGAAFEGVQYAQRFTPGTGVIRPGCPLPKSRSQ